MKCLTRRLSWWVLSRFFTENLQHSWAKPGLLQIKEINLFKLEVLLTRLVVPRQTQYNCWLAKPKLRYFSLNLSPPSDRVYPFTFQNAPRAKKVCLKCWLSSLFLNLSSVRLMRGIFFKRNSMHSVWGSEFCRAAVPVLLCYALVQYD